jgi:hypothetical protein
LTDDFVEVLRPVFAVEGGHVRGGGPWGNQGFPHAWATS